MVEPETTDDNIHRAHAFCMLDDKGYKHTLRICNIYCYSRYTNASQCYGIFTLLVLFSYVSIQTICR